MPSPIRQLVSEIHATPTRLVLAVTGGGSRAISRLLEVPGASRTVLEAAVPYSGAAMVQWLGTSVEQACSVSTARAMAMAAFRRACRYHDDPDYVAGIACTASLATDRPKRGEHRLHLAIQTAARTAAYSLRLTKGQRSRTREENLTTRMVLNLVAEACSLPRRLEVGLLENERVEQVISDAPAPWRELLLGRVELVRHGRPLDYRHGAPRAIFPGAFNPLHSGHCRMAEIARNQLGVPVEFEISILNVDKLPLDYLEMERRTERFSADQILWLTRAATFEEKSRLFCPATFVVGVDTIQRIANPRYYGNSAAARDATVRALAERGCRFLVFGRRLEDRFMALADLELPESLGRLCRGVSEDQFREDVSSTEIREAADE